jgi:hypothetical protein
MKYCKQCTESFKFQKENDFKKTCDIGSVRRVYCDGCGPTLVDHLGLCVGKCDDEHGLLDTELPNGDYIMFSDGRVVKDNHSDILQGKD